MTPPDLGLPQHPLANLDHRVLAFLIDIVIFFIIYMIVYWMIGPTVADLISNRDHSKNVDELTSGLAAGFVYLNALLVVLFCTTAIVQVIWGGLLEGIWGLTPGKAALRLKRKPVKLKVVSADDHTQTIGFARGIAREIIRPIPMTFVSIGYVIRLETNPLSTVLFLLSILVFVLNHLWPRWDEERQALHDKIANSHVVNTHERESEIIEQDLYDKRKFPGGLR